MKTIWTLLINLYNILQFPEREKIMKPKILNNHVKKLEKPSITKKILEKREHNFRKKYEDKYITVESIGSKKVISYEIDEMKVYQQAVKKGYEHPIIIYVMKEGTSFLF